MITLPLDTSQENYSFQVQLDSVNYEMRFYWNQRTSSWFFDLTRVSDQLRVLSQQRVTVSTAPLHQYVGDQFPIGELVVVDTAGSDEDPGVNDLGARVQMYYLEVAAGDTVERV